MCGTGKKAEELLVMDEKNMRNCRDRANKNQSRVVQVQVILLWSMEQTSYPLQGPSSLISCYGSSCLLQEGTLTPVMLGFLSFPIWAGHQAVRSVQVQCIEQLQDVGAMGLASSSAQ